MVLSKREMGLLIKKARQHKSEITGRKYTQAMLAEDLEISRGYIGDIENGRIYPNYVLLNKIAEKCEVSFSFFGEENMDGENYTEKDFSSASKPSQPDLDYPEIADVQKAMEVIFAQKGLMLNGELLSDESKIILANAIQMGIALAEKRQKEEKKQL